MEKNIQSKWIFSTEAEIQFYFLKDHVDLTWLLNTWGYGSQGTYLVLSMIKPLLERRTLESRDKARNKPDVGVVDVERVVDVQLGIAHLVEELKQANVK